MKKMKDDVEIIEEEQYEDTSYFEENYERTKPLGRLILLVAFTAIMLVSSTYAWFSTQKNVTLGGLEGKVNVAEGLQISLDALNWKNSIDLSDAGIASYFAQTNASLNTEYDLENPYDGRTNVIPDELLPVSTTAQSGDGIGLQRINMYGGENTDGIVLSNIELLDEVPESGYYAIDFFLQNTSAETATANDLLKLDSNSELRLLSSDKTTTGLQNTVRVAFALFDNDGTDNIKVNKTPTQTQILAGTNNQNIIDVAIWEPNASGDNAHVEYVIQNNNRITWSIADASTYFNKTITTPEVIRFDGDDLIPTYAITGTSTSSTYTVGSGATATTVNGIDDIYNWASNLTTTGLTKQNTVKTTTDGVTELTPLLSVTDGTTEFSIAPGEYHKLRMYIWLEGQDVDCLNYASLGGGIYLNVGITKGNENNTSSDTTGGAYLPTGFSYVDDPETEVTIADGSGNEYVWVSVPKDTTVYSADTLALDLDNLTGEYLTAAYSAIESDLQAYTSDYRDSSYADTWSSEDATGLSETSYNALKNRMLESIFENEGFYVGKYESGIADSYRNYDEDYYTEHPITETAVIQEDAYTYNWVRCGQAQSLANGMASGEYTSSLLFGLQWDLVLKYMETKGASVAELTSDSTEWGNYYNNTFTTNASAKYSIDYGVTWTSGAYEKTTYEAVLLSTGASTEFQKAGIYDIAGNVFEWTLENYTSDSSYPCVGRGGYCGFNGGYGPAAYRDYGGSTVSYDGVGFRVAIY